MMFAIREKFENFDHFRLLETTIFTRGKFHKTKKFVISKIIFVITNVSNFVFSISTVCLLHFTNFDHFRLLETTIFTRGNFFYTFLCVGK